MKKFFTLLCLSVPFCSGAQVMCGTANEGGSVTLTAPVGNVFTSIEFASYGTPNGSCGSFTIGACHASGSSSTVSSIFVGNNSASVSATNGVFGDPCGGTVKRLYIQATYSAVIPLTLLSFTAKKIDQSKVRLDWSSENEINTSHFVIERSSDGEFFEAMDSVGSQGNGKASYSFTGTIPDDASIYYFRLKMVDIDGKFQYSNIVRVNNKLSGRNLFVLANPLNKIVTIISSRQQKAFIMNSAGQLIRELILINGSQTIDIAAWNSGIYFIKTQDGVGKFAR